MKKFVSYIFITIFMLSIGIIGVKAESMGLEIEKGDSKSSLKAGDIITVNYIVEAAFNLDEPLEIAGTELTVYFNQEIFEIIKNGYDYHSYSAYPLSGGSYSGASTIASSTIEQNVDGQLLLGASQKKLLATFKFKVKEGVTSQTATIYSSDRDRVYCNFYDYGESRKDICAYGYGNSLSYTIEGVNNTPQEENNVVKPQTVTTTKAQTTQTTQPTTTTEPVTEETTTTEPTTIKTTKPVEKVEVKEEKKSTNILTMILCILGGAVAAVIATLSILSLKKNKNTSLETSVEEPKEEKTEEK